ncbi:Dabb family protein [Agreia sp. PsM10]|uniref:Dabb family protein n=1 Tax=Agreia sp. PsM10 TaxID=3030533 RepID=UPI00263B6A8C|nr:Dabb family protein [Agreia sp. PsM10]MDN4639988.1 Dabb family protein [Agreia sp. PsM10]
MTTASERLHTELLEVGVERFTSSTYKPGPVLHIVLFRFDDGVQHNRRDHAVASFHMLAQSERDGRPYIESIVSGAQLSGEDGANDYEYGFVVRFGSLGDRNYYVGEPIITDPRHYDTLHAAFKKEIGPLLRPQDGVQVMDFLPDPHRRDARRAYK